MAKGGRWRRDRDGEGREMAKRGRWRRRRRREEDGRGRETVEGRKEGRGKEGGKRNGKTTMARLCGSTETQTILAVHVLTALSRSTCKGTRRIPRSGGVNQSPPPTDPVSCKNRNNEEGRPSCQHVDVLGTPSEQWLVCSINPSIATPPVL